MVSKGVRGDMGEEMKKYHPGLRPPLLIKAGS